MYGKGTKPKCLKKDFKNNYISYFILNKPSFMVIVKISHSDFLKTLHGLKAVALCFDGSH